MTGKSLRIVFMGTPDFAVESLKALVENKYNVVGVITAPDKPAGRGRQLHESAVKQYAASNNLKILQPEKLKNPAFLDELKALEADLQVVVAFRMLPEVVWNMPPLGTFNLHGSLLPKYRGAAPINWAIINGEKETGVTTFKIQHEIDTGNIIYRELIAIGDNDNVEVIHDKLMELGSKLVVKTVDALADGEVKMINQQELIDQGYEPTPAPKIFKENCKIDWNQDCKTINNFIRGLSPYPTSWTEIKKEGVDKTTSAKIFQVETEKTNYNMVPGQVYSDEKSFFKIGCTDGWISVKILQLAGKKRMKVEDFLRGFQEPEKYACL